jgi:hypothetical protein
MNAPIDVFPPNAKEPEPWDRAGAPSDLPFEIQEKAIEELLREEPGAALVSRIPADLGEKFVDPLPEPQEKAAATKEPDPLAEEFKPTADEWENVKEILRPHPGAASLVEDRHPAYKPEFLERDGESTSGGGDWNEVETERTKD